MCFVLLILGVDQNFQEVAEYLHAFLDLPLDQIEDTLGEILVELQPLGVKVAVNGTFQVKVGFIEVLIIKPQLCDLKQRVASINLPSCVVVLDDLLKVEDGFILNLLKLFGHFLIDQLVVHEGVIQILPRKYLADVEVCLDL